MTEHSEFHICPHCGFGDIPILIVKRAEHADAGFGWRCHACHGDWTDADLRHLRAS